METDKRKAVARRLVTDSATAPDGLTSFWREGVQRMTEGYTCAEAALHVLSKARGWDPTLHAWVPAGYAGAIQSGKTTCGLLFGATIYLGLLHGGGEMGPPVAGSDARSQAIAAVHDLYRGFIVRFGDTDCQTLTGCNWGVADDVRRYYKEEVFSTVCLRQWEYVLEKCLDLGN